MVVRVDEAIALDIYSGQKYQYLYNLPFGACNALKQAAIGARKISHLGIWKGFGSFF